jgi:hypothetical protein
MLFEMHAFCYGWNTHQKNLAYKIVGFGAKDYTVDTLPKF